MIIQETNRTHHNDDDPHHKERAEDPRAFKKETALSNTCTTIHE
jgi:hypothetical protein